MRNLFTHLFFCLALGAVAQPLSRAAEPTGNPAVLPLALIAPPSPAEIAPALQREPKTGTAYITGYNHPVDFGLEAGQWTAHPNGARTWQFRLGMPGAAALGLRFDRFFLPPGARLQVYRPDKTRVQGAYTSAHNRTNGRFVVPAQPGDELVVELYEPGGQRGRTQLHLSEVTYHFRPIGRPANSGQKTDDFGDADACNVNVNCSEGDNWKAARDASLRIEVEAGFFVGWCSGTLVNNTAQNDLPYVLTAYHCGERFSGGFADQSDLDNWVFYFNYQTTGCEMPVTDSLVPLQTLTGARLIASSEDPGDFSSDFALLQIEQEIPAAYDAYFAGWDRSPVVASGVSIHHPSGDVKKISTLAAPAVSTSWLGNVPDSHWDVVWKATPNGHGVTEQGSSGSGLFNASQRLVGTLTGGSSFCSTPTAPDAYGKFSYHWNNNGALNTQQLAPWLDPLNSGTMALDGKRAGVTARDLPGQGEEGLNARVYPSPTTGQVSVEIQDVNAVNDANVAVFNTVGGRVNVPVKRTGNGRFTVDLTGQAHGLYFVKVTGGDKSTVQKVQLAG